MTLHFPDIYVWIALTVVEHVHNTPATRWLNSLGTGGRLIFSRFTQIGFIRLLTNPRAMERVLNTRDAWAAFDAWREDPRVDFHSEPSSIDAAFRQATTPFFAQPASKWIGDCYLLAFARETGSTLVTFAKALQKLAASNGYSAIIPD